MSRRGFRCGKDTAGGKRGRPRPGGTAGRARHRVGHARPGRPNRHITSRRFHPETPPSFHPAPHCGVFSGHGHAGPAGATLVCVLHEGKEAAPRHARAPSGPPPSSGAGRGADTTPPKVPTVLPPGAPHAARSPAAPRGLGREQGSGRWLPLAGAPRRQLQDTINYANGVGSGCTFFPPLFLSLFLAGRCGKEPPWAGIT